MIYSLISKVFQCFETSTLILIAHPERSLNFFKLFRMGNPLVGKGHTKDISKPSNMSVKTTKAKLNKKCRVTHMTPLPDPRLTFFGMINKFHKNE